MSLVKGLSFFLFFFLIFSKKKFSFIDFLLFFVCLFVLSVSFISTLIFTDFLCGSAGKESSYSVGDLGSISDLEDPLENRMSTHYSVLAWRIPWTK